jgi:hypothetical protein
MAVLMTIGINALTYVPVENQAEAEKKSSAQVESVRLEIASENDEWATGYDKDGNSYVVNEEWVQVGDVIDAMVDEFGEIDLINHVEPEKEISTEVFVVQEKTADGYLNAVSISEDTNAPYGYILDDKYELGDVVEVTYSNDEIFAEREIVGDELDKLENEKGSYINAVLEDGMKNQYEEEYVQAEDGSIVPVSFYE